MKFTQLGYLSMLILGVGCKEKSQYITPESKPIIESVYASATINAAEQYTLYPALSGRILNLAVSEGDVVQAGQLIAHLDNTGAALTASTAGEAVALSKTSAKQLQEIQAQLATAQEQAKLDSLNYKRQQNLWAQNIGSQTQLEAKKLAAAASKNAVKAIQSKLSVAQSQLAFNQKQAQNNQGTAAKNLAEFDVRSDIGGQVFQLLAEKGEWVSPQKPLAILGNSGDYLIHMEVDEVDIAKIKVGQTAVIALDAYKGKSFKGHVTRIIPIMNTKSQSFEVEAVFDEKPNQLYPGLSAEVNIIIAEKSSALLIPLSCLGKDNVVATEDGDVVVKPGLRNLEYVEILEGLTPTTKILAPKAK
jgi:HlyD family secretion protein